MTQRLWKPSREVKQEDISEAGEAAASDDFGALLPGAVILGIPIALCHRQPQVKESHARSDTWSDPLGTHCALCS